MAKPADEELAVEKPTVKKSVIEKPVVEKPADEKTAVEKPVIEKPVVEKPVVEKSAFEKPTVQKTVAEKPAAIKTSFEKPAVVKPAVRETTIDKPVLEKPTVAKPSEKEPTIEKPVMVKSVVKETIAKTPTIAEPLPVKTAVTPKEAELPAVEHPSPAEKMNEVVEKPAPVKVTKEKEEATKLRKSTSKEIKEQPGQVVEPVYVEEKPAKPVEVTEKLKPVEEAKPVEKFKPVEVAKPVEKPVPEPTPTVTEVKPARTVTPKAEPERKVSDITQRKVEEKVIEQEEPTPKLKPVLKKTPRLEDETLAIQKVKPSEPTIKVAEMPAEKAKETPSKPVKISTPVREPKVETVVETTTKLEQDIPTGRFTKEESLNEIEQAEQQHLEEEKREEERAKIEKSVSFTLSPKEMSPTPSEEHEPNLVKKKKKKKKEKLSVSPTKDTTTTPEADKEVLTCMETEDTAKAADFEAAEFEYEEAKEMSPEPLITDIAQKLDTTKEQIKPVKAQPTTTIGHDHKVRIKPPEAETIKTETERSYLHEKQRTFIEKDNLKPQNLSPDTLESVHTQVIKDKSGSTAQKGVKHSVNKPTPTHMEESKQFQHVTSQSINKESKEENQQHKHTDLSATKTGADLKSERNKEIALDKGKEKKDTTYTHIDTIEAKQVNYA